MKRIILLILLAVITTVARSQSSSKVEIKDDKVIELSSQKNGPTRSTFVFVDKNGLEYPIYITDTGRCFYYKISKNGNEYKKYLDKDTSKEICNRLNIEYKENKKSSSHLPD